MFTTTVIITLVGFSVITVQLKVKGIWSLQTLKILKLEEPTSIMCHGFIISFMTVSGATEPKYVIGNQTS